MCDSPDNERVKTLSHLPKLRAIETSRDAGEGSREVTLVTPQEIGCPRPDAEAVLSSERTYLTRINRKLLPHHRHVCCLPFDLPHDSSSQFLSSFFKYFFYCLWAVMYIEVVHETYPRFFFFFFPFFSTEFLVSFSWCGNYEVMVDLNNFLFLFYIFFH